MAVAVANFFQIKFLFSSLKIEINSNEWQKESAHPEDHDEIGRRFIYIKTWIIEL